MSKDKFNSRCRELSNGTDYQLSKYVLDTVREERNSKSLEKLPVIWLETCDSGDNNIAFMNTTYPYLGQVFSGLIDLLYSNTFMAAQGKDALDILEQAAAALKGKFTLIVEGAIPLKDNGLYTIIAQSENYSLTALAALNWLGPLAKYVVALGTCASFGGVSGARPNVTGSAGVQKVLNREVINVSGCPVNPDWFVGTLAHLLLYGIPELDELNRPKLFYGFTIHRHCQRRSYFDRKQFAEKLGDIECMFSLGCVGPKTGADCPYRQWINHVSWPVKANTPCIGCTNEDFPDGSTPFFTPLPEKNPQSNEKQPAAPAGGERDE